MGRQTARSRPGEACFWRRYKAEGSGARGKIATLLAVRWLEPRNSDVGSPEPATAECQVHQKEFKGLRSLLLRKQRSRRAELRLGCGVVRCVDRDAHGAGHARALHASAPQGSTRFGLEFAALDTRLNTRLSRWSSRFAWPPMGQHPRVCQLRSSVV